MSDSERELERVEERLTVLRARQGDERSFQKLVERYDRRLLYFVRRFERDAGRASDLVQDVWLTVFRKIGTLESPEAFRAWLYRIAHARAVTAVRREVQRDSVERSASPPESGAASAPLDDAELVHHALERLSAEHREVLVLRFLEQMTIEEIADVLSCPPGTVKSRLHYAKEAMRQAVEELNHGRKIRA